MKNILPMIVTAMVMTASLMGAGYYGISKSLCSNINSYTAHEQAEMKLNNAVCDKYYR